jgi:hypothetical protein
MSYQNAEEVDSVFQAIANWIQRYREAIGLRAELAICEPQHVAEIAKDIGLSSDQLRFAVERDHVPPTSSLNSSAQSELIRRGFLRLIRH